MNGAGHNLLVLGSRKPDGELKRALDRFVARADRAALARGDPVDLVHRYADPDDQEVAGLLVAMLAYGRVASIKAKASRVLDLLGPHPARAVADRRRLAKLDGFIYRFQSGADVMRFAAAIGRVRKENGTLASAFFACTQNEEPTYAVAMSRFTSRLASAIEGDITPGLRFLVPGAEAPSGASGAAKRLALFLRWMIRGPDGVDLGAFRKLEPALTPSKLIIPLDTHIERIGRYLGLTDRKTGGLKTAMEITGTLARLCPEDPLVYDLVLCHLGISGRCPRKRDTKICADCPIKSVCRLGEAPPDWRY